MMSFESRERWDRPRVDGSYPRKKTWREVTDTAVLKIYKELVNRAIELGYLEDDFHKPSLYYTTRGNFVGTCYQQLGAPWTYDDGNTHAAILLHVNVLSYTPDGIREILCHELGHAVSRITEGHGTMWRYRTQRLGQPWNVPVSQTVSVKTWEKGGELSREYAAAHNVGVYKWQLVCPQCGKEYTKYKSLCASLQRPRWACPHCHVALYKKNLLTNEISEIVRKK